MTERAPIIEVFSSLQGEGPHVGSRHLFVRFQDCSLNCRFCDTPLSFVSNKFCRVEYPAFSKRFRQILNPLSVEELNAVVGEFDDSTLAVTGGEPLEKADFLKAWLPTVRNRFKVLIETAGIHATELKSLIDLIDIVSMDFKLPSSTGMHAWWREHEAFLHAARGKEIYIKAVVTSETSAEDIVRGMELVSSFDRSIPFVLQPATPFGKFKSAPTTEQLASWQTMVQEKLSDVRVIPQMHKQMGIL